MGAAVLASKLSHKTDWHEVEEHRFAYEMVAMLDRLLRERYVEGLVAVASPRALPICAGFSPGREKEDHRRIDKDLTKHPVDQIERHLAV